MIRYIHGDIFTSPTQTIVNPVNTVGVMGKGLAAEFKRRYPDMYAGYRTACEKHLLVPGKLMLFRECDYQVLLFPTKEDWLDPSRIEYIEAGLAKFVSSYESHGITSIGFPRLGCGCGGLNWQSVKSVMERYLHDLPIDVYILLGPQEGT